MDSANRRGVAILARAVSFAFDLLASAQAMYEAVTVDGIIDQARERFRAGHSETMPATRVKLRGEEFSAKAKVNKGAALLPAWPLALQDC